MSNYGAASSAGTSPDGEQTRLIYRDQADPLPFDIESQGSDTKSKFKLFLQKLKTWQGITICIGVVILLFIIYTINGGFGSLTIIQSVVPTYTVYVVRHAEAKYANISKCDPVQDPKLPDSIGKCGESWGANRCGGDYLTNEGLERARCIADNVRFEGLTRIMAQYPGTCFDKNVKREYQTVLALAHKHGMEIDSSLGRGDEWETATKLTSVDMRRDLCGSGSFTLSGASVSLGSAVAEEEGETSSWNWFPHDWGWGDSSSRTRSVVVAWDHSMLPDLLKYMGCGTDAMCTTKLGFLEFDTYYKVTYSCVDSELLNVVQLHQNCNEAFSAGSVDE